MGDQDAAVACLSGVGMGVEVEYSDSPDAVMLGHRGG